MHTIKSEVLDSLKKEINNSNCYFLEILQKKMETSGESNYLGSIEFFKIAYSNNLLEDLDLLISLSGNKVFKVRHANSIIRTMLEQTIEFIYLLKYPNLMDEYLGCNIELDNINIDNETNLVMELTQFGKSRFSGGRTSISKMAKEVNEKSSKDDRLSLYEIYMILSEDSHNAYFQAILDDINEFEVSEESIALEEIQVTYLMLIIDAFMSSYRLHDI